jgi:hypothetical protein
MEAEGDREVALEEVVDLADGIAGANGVASGMGTNRFGAQVYVEADDRADAIDMATAIFTAALDKAGLPAWPLSYIKAISEADDLEADQDDWAVWEHNG